MPEDPRPGSASLASPAPIAVDLSQLERAAVRVPQLSDRERQVLVQLATGQTNHLIARRLQLSEGTVKVHVGHILLKLGLGSRTAAAVVAFSYLNSSLHHCSCTDRAISNCLLLDHRGPPIE